MCELLELVNRPQTLGFQADMAHTMLFTMGYNAPEDRLLPENFDGRIATNSRQRIGGWPARCVPGQSTFTWRRTMAR